MNFFYFFSNVQAYTKAIKNFNPEKIANTHTAINLDNTKDVSKDIVKPATTETIKDVSKDIVKPVITHTKDASTDIVKPVITGSKSIYTDVEKPTTSETPKEMSKDKEESIVLDTLKKTDDPNGEKQPNEDTTEKFDNISDNASPTLEKYYIKAPSDYEHLLKATKTKLKKFEGTIKKEMKPVFEGVKYLKVKKDALKDHFYDQMYNKGFGDFRAPISKENMAQPKDLPQFTTEYPVSRDNKARRYDPKFYF